jgi:hypothetical protein
MMAGQRFFLCASEQTPLNERIRNVAVPGAGEVPGAVIKEHCRRFVKDELLPGRDLPDGRRRRPHVRSRAGPETRSLRCISRRRSYTPT